MKVFLGADHAGYKLKEKIKQFLEQKKIGFKDFGTNSTESCDYPDFAKKVATAVQKNKGSYGVLVCGTGTGTAIAANRFSGVRTVQATSEYLSKMAREHNNANVISLGARVTPEKDALKFVETFLSTAFSKEERHVRRVKKIG
ncbi:MAG: ribose 5-phosphate isomerase B [Candidatus Diapherotrites archaeon]|nr:ribose 5-phosphate isomerase B [Candidatus Diapherotrites archaeon]